MLIAGLKGHAKDVLSIFNQQGNVGALAFYDDLSDDLPALLFGKYPIIRTQEAVSAYFKNDNRFVLGVGNPLQRYRFAEKLIAAGGKLNSIISSTATIGTEQVVMGNGLNIMSQVVITNCAEIGEGVLANAHVSIHHDTRIGRYCELSPGARISGGCRIGEFCSIGLNAVILPKVTVGDNVIVGAGCVVNKDVGENQVVAGVPGKVIRKLEPLRL